MLEEETIQVIDIFTEHALASDCRDDSERAERLERERRAKVSRRIGNKNGEDWIDVRKGVKLNRGQYSMGESEEEHGNAHVASIIEEHKKAFIQSGQRTN